MVAVIFEVWPAEGRTQQYFDLAADLYSVLKDIDGFISVERFESLSAPGKILSLSFWRDEQAVEAWRQHELHRAAQGRGRAEVFKDYRIRVAEVVRHYGLARRTEAPADSLRFHSAGDPDRLRPSDGHR